MFIKSSLKILVLAGILLTAAVMQHKGVIDLSGELARVENLAQLWWAPLLFIFLKFALYSVAMPAGPFIWLLGVIYVPWAATLITIVGGLLGSLGAYYVAGYFSSYLRDKFSGTQAFSLLQDNSGFFQLLALRSLPGMPHALVNYSSGILQVRLMPYIITATLGFACKGFIYTSAVYNATHQVEEGAAIISIHAIWPLFLLVILSLAGIFFQKKYIKNPC